MRTLTPDEAGALLAPRSGVHGLVVEALFCAAMIQDFERTRTGRLLLRRFQEGDLDAVFSLHGDPETNNLAYRFGPQSWGSGYATEAALVALSLARKHIPDVPVVAIVHLENVPSLRVAERLGMRRDRIIDYEGVASAVYLAP